MLDFYVPSDELVEYWKVGVLSFTRGKVRRLFVTRQLKGATEEIREELQKTVLGVMVSRFRLHTSDTEQTFPLFGEDGFFDSLAPIYSDRIPVQDADVEPFLKKLRSEFEDYFRNGGILQASWGRVALEGSGVIVHLEKEEVVHYPVATSTIVDIEL